MKMNTRFNQMMLAAILAMALAGTANAQFGGGGFGGFPGGGGGGGQGRGGGQNQGLRTAPVNASYDTRTNTVIVSGPKETLDDIEKLIHSIDANPAQGNKVYVYKLRNGSALNIEAVANLLFLGTGGNNRGVQSAQTLSQNRVGSTGARGGARGGGAGGGLGGLGGGIGGGIGGGGRAGGGGTTFTGGASANTQTAAAGLVGQVSVVADPNTNALLVTTDPKNWPAVKAILDDLDRSVPQVLIKVLIAEVTHNDSRDLGVEFSGMNLRTSTVGAGTTAVTSTLGTIGGTNFNLPQFANGIGAIATITESNFAAALHALEINGKIDVLSRPYILASDNQPAEIIVGETVPYISSSNQTTNGNIINNVTYSDIGILLDVIPHINPDGMVLLDVAPEISAREDSTIQIAVGVNATVFSKRSAQSRVAVQNGQTVVIGGLMQDRNTVTVNKVPILGDLPFVGQLFQHEQKEKSKTELLIFMTPHVASRPDQLKEMGEQELDATKLLPNAVGPGEFQAHQKGMDVGIPTPSTQPYIRDNTTEIQTPGSQAPGSSVGPAGVDMPGSGGGAAGGGGGGE